MNIKLKSLLLSLFFLPAIALADCQCDDDNGVEDEDGVYRQYDYLGVKSGVSHYMMPGVLTNPISYGLHGGHRYNRIFAVEYGVETLGVYNQAGSGHALALNYSGVGYYDFTDNVSLIGKIGAAYTNPVHINGGTDTVDLVAGIGLDWRVVGTLILRAEYDNFKVAIPNKINVTNLGIGITVKY